MQVQEHIFSAWPLLLGQTMKGQATDLNAD